jgi:valyl-tRNA synthetase
VYPYDQRPQSHDIIRTWLFATVVRSHFEHDRLPWRSAVISGFITGHDGRKFSKSIGNAHTPTGLLERYGVDAVRYWAARGRPGADLTFDETQMRIGRRLATKLLNASKFVLGLGAPGGLRGPQGEASRAGLAGSDEVSAPLDRSMLAELSTVVDTATAAFDRYDHTTALDVTERFFWSFCDDHIELVKERAYAGDGSARAALRTALSALLRLLAPILPYVTEEVWSWWHTGSVHRAPWPQPPAITGDPALSALTSAALAQIRRAKSDRRLSMRAEVASAEIRGSAADLAVLEAGLPDLRAAGRLAEVILIRATADSSVPSIGIVVTCVL